jgi:hypothetical protein
MKDKNLPRTAIFEGILRCERVGNPAVVERDSYSVHVRKLPVADGRGWVIRVIDKTNVLERQEESTF